MRSRFVLATKLPMPQLPNHTVTADLALAGPACNSYGDDIPDLILKVEYQNDAQIDVKIYPRKIAPANRYLYILDESLSPIGSIAEGCTACSNDLTFEWSNDLTFKFRVKRAHSDEAIFDAYGHRIVFEDHLLELFTNIVPDYNVYGLPEAICSSFRLPNQYGRSTEIDNGFHRKEQASRKGKCLDHRGIRVLATKIHPNHIPALSTSLGILTTCHAQRTASGFVPHQLVLN